MFSSNHKGHKELDEGILFLASGFGSMAMVFILGGRLHKGHKVHGFMCSLGLIYLADLTFVLRKAQICVEEEIEFKLDNS